MLKIIYTKIIVITIILLSNVDLQATHFRYGHITWEIVDSTQAGIEVKFTVQTAWRITYFTEDLYSYGYFDYNTLSLGQKFVSGDFFFGDGEELPLVLTVTSLNSADDWVYGVAEFTHIYTESSPYTAYIEGCCRLENVNNINYYNPDYLVSTLLDLSINNRPPISNLPAIVNVPSNQDSISFYITAFDEDADPIRFRLATPAEVGTYTYSVPPNLTLDSNTGLVTWNPLPGGESSLWTLSVIIEDLDEYGDPKSFTQLDFFVNVTGESFPPQFVGATPPNNIVYELLPGDTINFVIEALDADTIFNNVTINATGIPESAIFSFEPLLPTPGSNPVSTEFTWIPTTDDLGTYAINFTATDETGSQALTVINIDVGFEPVFIEPTPGNNSLFCYSDGDYFNQEYIIIDLDSTDQVNLQLSLDTNLVNTTNPPPFTPGGGFPLTDVFPSSLTFNPSLPLSFGNPVSTNLTGTINERDWGIYILNFVSTDTDNDKTFLTNYLIIDQAPYFTTQVPNVINWPVGIPFDIVISANDDDLIYGDRIAFADSSKSYVTIPKWLNVVDDLNGNLNLTGTPALSQQGFHNVRIELHDRTTHFLHQHCTQEFLEFRINVRPIRLLVEPGPPNLVVGTELCTTITVTDDENNVLEGIEVNISSAADNPNAYSETLTTNADGQVEFCYTGTMVGYDECIITAGDQSQTYGVNWTSTGSTDCNNVAGLMQTSHSFVCHENSLYVGSAFSNVDANSVKAYVLHEGEEFDGLTFLTINKSGIFESLGEGYTNRPLYISAVIGVPDASGYPNFDDACTVWTPYGAYVVFFDPLSINIVEDRCESGQYYIDLTITGGVGGISSGYAYPVVSDGQTEHQKVFPNEVITFGPYTGNGVFTIETAGVKNCKSSLTNSYSCEAVFQVSASKSNTYQIIYPEPFKQAIEILAVKIYNANAQVIPGNILVDKNSCEIEVNQEVTGILLVELIFSNNQKDYVKILKQ